MTSRARFWRWAALVLLAALVAMAAFVPVPYTTSAPGPVFDVLGEHDGQPVVEISGTKQYPTSGALFMTTVASSGGGNGVVTVGSAVLSLLDPNASVAPEQDDRRTDADLQQAVFDASGSIALGAAATYLDRPVTTQPVILSVTPGSPSDGKLQPGDLVDAVNGRTVETREQLGRLIRREPVGTSFRMRVTRGDATERVTVVSEPAPGDPDRPVIGVLLDDHYMSDFEATVTLTQVGGPSAGLMFAVAIVDKLTPDNLLAGRDVAGTGTITGDGQVGPIGGIGKKMIAAQDAGAGLFVAPEANCPEVAAETPAGLQVVPVTTLAQTVESIEAWRAGKPLPTCPAAADSDGNG